MQIWQGVRPACPSEYSAVYFFKPTARSALECAPLPWVQRSAHRYLSFIAQAARSRASTEAAVEVLRPKWKDRATLSKEDQAFWEKVIEGIDREAPKSKLHSLDPKYPLGIPPQNRKGQRVTLFEKYLEYKRDHPCSLCIMKVGEFYETVGLDAVVLMQYCSLNPMAGKPFAACGAPLGNINQVLKELVREAGFSVVMVEEVNSRRSLKAGVQKERFISQIVTPQQPEYLFGLVDKKGVAAQNSASAPRIMGVASSVSGYKVMRVDVEMQRYHVEEGLTEDRVTSLLHKGGIAPPLYVHRPDVQTGTSLLTEASVENEWTQRIGQFMRCQAGNIKYYTYQDPVQGLLDSVKRELGISADVQFQEYQPDKRTRPKRIFLSTASQLGIHPNLGIPSLVDAILPSDATLFQINYIKRLLLQPPPADVTASIRKACSLLSDMTVPLPRWVLLDFKCVVRQIKQRETNEDSFRSLQQASKAARECLQAQDPLCAAFAEELLQPVKLECDFHLDKDILVKGCKKIEKTIDNVIEPLRDNPMASAGEEAVLVGGVEVLRTYFNDMEQFQGKVKKKLVETEFNQVAEAGEAVEKALRAAYKPLHNTTDLPRNKACIRYDLNNSAVWVKAVKGSAAAKNAATINEERTKKGEPALYVQPRDKKNGAIRDMWTTEQLDNALADYRTACENAHAAVRRELQALADNLTPQLAVLGGVTEFNNISSALEAHVREASRRGWALPVQLSPPQSHDNTGAFSAQEPPVIPMEQIVAGKRESLHIRGMWPYWLEGRSSNTVRNNLDLNSMVILTGPNMAGKSTVMRSVCAVALLSACGLYAPCESAVIPYIDAFMLRTFSADSPIEGKSSFAIEMSEMRHVLNDAGEHSLVLVDELGKGTEPMAGASIAAAFLRYLDSKRCRGFFATHLHQLLDMPNLNFKNVEYMCMETIEAQDRAAANSAVANNRKGFKDVAAKLGGRIPTWRVIPGTCQHSLAFVVMAQLCGVDEPIVADALGFYEDLKNQGRHEPKQTSRPIQIGISDTSKQILVQSPNESEAESSEPEEVKSVYSHHSSSLESARDTCSTAWPIEGAAALLEQTAKHVFSQQSSLSSSSIHEESGKSGQVLSSDTSSNGWDPSISIPAARAQVLRSGMEPPPATVGCSCVYIVRRMDGIFYAGETDDIKRRMKQHRLKSGKVKGGPLMEAAYIVVPSSLQGKSAAREVESAVIKSLQDAGYSLLSVTDGRNKRTSRAGQAVAIAER